MSNGSMEPSGRPSHLRGGVHHPKPPGRDRQTSRHQRSPSIAFDRVALRALSLCAGIGGVDLGLAPWCSTVGYVEREAFSAAVLVARMETADLDRAPVWDDLTTFDGRPWSRRVDLVTAGYPCQPFSVAGKRRGVDDKRHLWPHVRRVIDECGASLAFLENVPGHVSLGFDIVLKDLAVLGFDAEWCCLRASDIGAPHRRKRLFVLAYRRDDGRGSLRAAFDNDGRHAPGNDADGCDPNMADPDGVPLWFVAERHLPIEAERRDALAREHGARVVGDSDRARCWHEQRQLHAGGESCTRRVDPWPPGPNDREGWESWVAAGGPEPILRRGPHGRAGRVDRPERLRALGNAVVPAQARAAFVILASRILGQD